MLTAPESDLCAVTAHWEDDYSRIGEGRGGEEKQKQNDGPELDEGDSTRHKSATCS